MYKENHESNGSKPGFWKETVDDLSRIKHLRWVFILLWRSSKPWELCKALLQAFAQTALLFLIPYALQVANNVASNQPSGYLGELLLKHFSKANVLLILTFLGIGAAYGVAYYFMNNYTYYGRKFTDGTKAQLKQDYFAGTLYQPLSYHKETDTAAELNKLEKLSADIYRFLYSDLVMKGLRPLVSIPIFLVIVYMVNPLLPLFSLLPFILLVLVSFKYAPKISKSEHKSYEQQGDIAQFNQNVLQNIRTVKMFASESFFVRLSWERLQQQLQIQEGNNMDWRKLTLPLHLGAAVFMFIVSMYLSMGVYQGMFIAGIMFTVFWYFYYLIDNLMSLCFTYNAGYVMAPKLQQLSPILSAAIQLEQVEAERKDLKAFVGIEVQNLSFSHPPRGKGEAKVLALSDISCNFPIGEATALVGHNGCGKTTLLDLLSGIETPESGQILIDGKVLDESRRRDYVRMVGYTPQNPELFQDTLRMNMKLGKPDASDEDMIRLAKRVGIHDYIASLPSQYDTRAGDLNKLGISGGQQKRLMLVRALLPAPQILLFDEPTAALDADGKIMLMDLIREQKGLGKTIIMVTHDPSELDLCDNIIRFEKGKIVNKEESNQTCTETAVLV